MANTKRAYATDTIFGENGADSGAALQDRIDLLRRFYLDKHDGGESEPANDGHATSSTIFHAPHIKQNYQEYSPAIPFPKYKSLDFSPSEFMWALQEWDGNVTSIENGQFTATLSPVGDGDTDLERLEYPLSSLSERDRANICVGSVFRMSAGYSRKATGQLRQQLLLYFRPKSRLGAVEKIDVGRRFKSLFRDARHAPASDLFTPRE